MKHMAPDAGPELIDFLWPSQAATLLNSDPSSSGLCDEVFCSMITKIKKCTYFDLNQPPTNLSKKSHMTLSHLNIRPLHKNFDLLHEFLVTLNFSSDIICLTDTH